MRVGGANSECNDKSVLPCVHVDSAVPHKSKLELVTPSQEAFVKVLEYFRNSNKEKIDPSIVVAPYDASLLTAAKNVFHEATITP